MTENGVEKKILGTLIAVGTLIGGSWAIYAIFETKEAHTKDLIALAEKEVLERKLLGAEIAIQLKEMIEQEHHKKQVKAEDTQDEDSEEVEILARDHFEREIGD